MTTTRLVNAYIIREVPCTGGIANRPKLDHAVGDVDLAIGDAFLVGAIGVLIVDVETGEEWFTPTVSPPRPLTVPGIPAGTDLAAVTAEAKAELRRVVDAEAVFVVGDDLGNAYLDRVDAKAAAARTGYDPTTEVGRYTLDDGDRLVTVPGGLRGQHEVTTLTDGELVTRDLALAVARLRRRRRVLDDARDGAVGIARRLVDLTREVIGATCSLTRPGPAPADERAVELLRTALAALDDAHDELQRSARDAADALRIAEAGR